MRPVEGTDAPTPPAAGSALCPCCWPPWQCAPVVQRRGARPRTTFTGHAAAFALRRRGGPTSNAPYTAPGQYAVGHRPLAPWPRCLVTCWWWGGGCCEPRATTVSAVRGKRCFVRLWWMSGFSGFPEISHKMFAASTAFREMHFTTPLFRLNIGRNNCAHLQSGTIPDSVGCGQPNGTIAMYGKDLLTPHMSLLCMRLIDRVGVSTMESGVGLMP